MCMDNERNYYSISEIAELLDIPYEEAYELTRESDFPRIEIYSELVVPARGFVEWLTAQGENNEDEHE